MGFEIKRKELCLVPNIDDRVESRCAMSKGTLTKRRMTEGRQKK